MVPVIVVADGGAHLFPAQVTEPVVPVAPVTGPPSGSPWRSRSNQVVVMNRPRRRRRRRWPSRCAERRPGAAAARGGGATALAQTQIQVEQGSASRACSKRAWPGSRERWPNSSQGRSSGRRRTAARAATVTMKPSTSTTWPRAAAPMKAPARAAISKPPTEASACSGSRGRRGGAGRARSPPPCGPRHSGPGRCRGRSTSAPACPAGRRPRRWRWWCCRCPSRRR